MRGGKNRLGSGGGGGRRRGGPSARVLHARGDAFHGDRHRVLDGREVEAPPVVLVALEEPPDLLVAGVVAGLGGAELAAGARVRGRHAAQTLQVHDLQNVQGREVGLAHLDLLPERARVSVLAPEDVVMRDNGEQRVTGQHEALLKAVTQVPEVLGDQALLVHEGNLRVGLGEDHLGEVDHDLEEGPLPMHLPQQGGLTALLDRLDGLARAEPHGEVEARLRPCEDPGDRPQRLDAGRGPPLAGAATDVHTPDLRLRRGGLEEPGAAQAGELLHRLPPLGLRGDRGVEAVLHVAAVYMSRVRKHSSVSPKSLSMISPWIVTLRFPLIVPGGWLRTASWHGPPPRPTVPPRPWKNVTCTPKSLPTSTRAPCAR